MRAKSFFTGLNCLIMILLISRTADAQVPSGYYESARNKQKDALKTALHQLGMPLRELTYGSGKGSTWEGFYQTDRNQDGTVVDMYSSIVRYFNGYNSITDMHIEHSFPKSWWGGINNEAYKDLFHLYPADGVTNSTKNNYPLGEIYGTPSFNNGVSKIGPNGFGGVYTGTCFEPADEFKGDFARSYFYIVTTYENLSPTWTSPMLNRNTYPSWTPWAINLLLKWHQQDPVSIKEKTRQEAVYKIQGNRNPFIDYPDLVSYIWGSDTTSVYPFPPETNAFISSPKRGLSLEYGIILKNDQKSSVIHLQGVNLTSALTCSFKRNLMFAVSSATLSQSQSTQGSDISVTFKPTKTGIFIDTLVIGGGGLDQPFLIPLKGQAAGDMLILEPEKKTPVGAEINWIADPFSTQYKVKIKQGSAVAGNLFISAYVEGSSYNKALEIYNGTGKTVDLGNYSLQKQSNGSGDFESNYQLSGQLQSGGSYIIVNKYATAGSPIKLIANTMTDSVLNFNGNDAVALLHHGVIIDVVGNEDTGDADYWGQDKTLLRKKTVTHPAATFDMNEWDVDAKDSIRSLTKHQFQAWLPETTVYESFISSQQTSCQINTLEPETPYVCQVESYRSGTIVQSVNTARFVTSGLEAPVVMDAGDVKSNSFIAGWESDLYLNTYLLDVFRATGTADTTINEGFNAVGSNGKPLPDGWTGTATGNYTTTASSGASVPSLALKNTGEYVQTSSMPGPITRFRFMYRYPSGAGTSYFTVEGLNGINAVRIDSIPYVNTSKYFMDYQFSKAQNIRSIRITYSMKASTGNLSLDDFSMTCDNQTILYVLKDQPVTGTEFLVESLLPATGYYYRIRAIKGAALSPYSETIYCTTSLGTDVLTSLNHIIIQNLSEGIGLSGLPENGIVQVYNIAGKKLFQVNSTLDYQVLPIHEKGVFLVVLKHQSGTKTYKIFR